MSSAHRTATLQMQEHLKEELALQIKTNNCIQLQLKSSQKQLSDETHRKDAAVENSENLEKKISSQGLQVEMLIKETENLHDENETSLKNNAALKQEIDKMRRDIDEMKNELSSNNENIYSAAQHHSLDIYCKLHRANLSLTNQIEIITKEKESITNDKDTLINEKEISFKENESLLNENETLSQNNAAMRQEIDIIIKDINAMKTELTSHNENMHPAEHDLDMHCNTLQRNVLSHTEQIKTVTKEKESQTKVKKITLKENESLLKNNVVVKQNLDKIVQKMNFWRKTHFSQKLNIICFVLFTVLICAILFLWMKKLL